MSSSQKQYRAYRAQVALDRITSEIDSELKLRTERRHLEPRLELARIYLDDLGTTTLAAVYRAKVEPLAAKVAAVPWHKLRVVR